jgi:hypothetical protein
MLVKVGQAEPSDLHGRVGTAERVTMTSGAVPLGQLVPHTTEYVVVALWLVFLSTRFGDGGFGEDLPEHDLRGQGDGAEGERLKLHGGDLFRLKGYQGVIIEGNLLLEGHERTCKELINQTDR